MKLLKSISLGAWAVLLMSQLALFWPAANVDYYWILLLFLPLLLPAKGLYCDQRYTYKWIGFMALFYFCVGISELVSNPELRIYGFATTISSTLLFLASIYYARFLGIKTETS
jgi:uncharacterized membrane protein